MGEEGEEGPSSKAKIKGILSEEGLSVALFPGWNLAPRQLFRKRRGRAGECSHSRGEKRDANFPFFPPVVSSSLRGEHRGDWEG